MTESPKCKKSPLIKAGDKRNSLRAIAAGGAHLMLNPMRWTVALSAIAASSARSNEDSFNALFNEITGGKKPSESRIFLETPRLADNGHSAAFRVYVDSPMSESDFVKSIFILSDRNPRPFVARFDLTPLNPKAEISTRVRLNGSQNVHALALTSKGEWFTAHVPVEVTESACLDAS